MLPYVPQSRVKLWNTSPRPKGLTSGFNLCAIFWLPVCPALLWISMHWCSFVLQLNVFMKITWLTCLIKFVDVWWLQWACLNIRYCRQAVVQYLSRLKLMCLKINCCLILMYWHCFGFVLVWCWDKLRMNRFVWNKCFISTQSSAIVFLSSIPPVCAPAPHVPALLVCMALAFQRSCKSYYCTYFTIIILFRLTLVQIWTKHHFNVCNFIYQHLGLEFSGRTLVNDALW